MADLIMVHCAAGSAEEAERLSALLLDDRLAACVQVAPIVSHFVWKGERMREAEHLMIIKTCAELFDKICETLRRSHSYETPEITAVPISAADPDYAAWVKACTTPAHP